MAISFISAESRGRVGLIPASKTIAVWKNKRATIVHRFISLAFQHISQSIRNLGPKELTKLLGMQTYG